ncbi:hypothetical protein Q428_03370 [Fervidicella metallireducens AeB]|uniref:Topo IA-type catalytic domain-containing protein n=1 Tax=Fervidicella metallireducens AeB TaxID=1403537 RepID=A0A017RZG0_9CLOT|nr:hypothetical protein Q428_03370 [Fervidicella metallireducens AeB]
MICDREKEIKEFVAKEYWSITAKLSADNKTFEAKFFGDKNGKMELENKEQVEHVIRNIENSVFNVSSIKKQEKRKNPLPPFTTSTLQQEAYKKLNFTTKKTMSIAQQLYEGIEIKKHGSVGLITYMRTDSVRVSEEAQINAKNFINSFFGEKYIAKSPRNFKTKKNIQDAHEAIRPTYVEMNPEEIKDSLTNDQYKLYKLIWSRFLASQMSEAVYDTISVDILCKDYLFRTSGSTIKFEGFLKVYSIEEDDDNIKLPEIQQGENLKLKSIEPKQHFTQPPSRYTEASLVKALEENGIGRPSTYAPIITTIIERGYVEREKKNLVATELGEIVTDLLKEYFNSIVDIEFTAEMERKLDEIEEGKVNWKTVIENFYEPLKELIKIAEDNIGKITLEEQVEETDILCEKCGRKMVIKKGKYGKFLACPGYPDCKNAKPMVEELDVDCPNCNGKIVVRKSKKGKVFYGCNNYPECNFVSWDKPTNAKCPECGSLLVEKTVRGKKQYKCINKQCNYKKIEG